MNPSAPSRAAQSDPVQLNAGPVSVTYSSGSLRRLVCGGAEVLRQIYVGVRDPRWRTLPGRVLRETIERGEDRFLIAVTVQHQQDEIDFTWDGTIQGEPDGSIRFRLEGVAASDFRANRIGLCVLHPVEGCAGRDAEIEHTSGPNQTLRFPELVSPHQPFLDVRAISHRVVGGVRATVRVEGDVFETEDQRNWTDDSFKTYSRPLTLPFPYKVAQGERMSQSVTVTFQGVAPQSVSGLGPVHLNVKDAVTSFPRIGLRRADLHLNAPTWRDELERARYWGPVECAIFTADAANELPLLMEALEQQRPEVTRWLVFDANSSISPASAASFHAALSKLYPGVPVGGGSSANFAELNRNRGVVEGLDFVCWGVNPQSHLLDEQTVIENLQGLRPTVRTARSFCGERPLSISVVTLPHPTAAAASWIVGSLKHLAEAGVQSVTYRDIPGAEAVLAVIEEFLPDEVVASSSSDPLSVECLTVRKGSRVRMIAANMLGHEQEVLIARKHRLCLAAYGVAFIDLTN